MQVSENTPSRKFAERRQLQPLKVGARGNDRLTGGTEAAASDDETAAPQGMENGGDNANDGCANVGEHTGLGPCTFGIHVTGFDGQPDG